MREFEFEPIFRDFASCRGIKPSSDIATAWFKRLQPYDKDQVSAAMAKAAMGPPERPITIGQVLETLGPVLANERALAATSCSEETERAWADVERHNRAGRHTVFEIAEEQSRHDPAALRRVREPGPTRDFLAMAQSVIDKQRAGRTGEARQQAAATAQAMAGGSRAMAPQRPPSTPSAKAESPAPRPTAATMPVRGTPSPPSRPQPAPKPQPPLGAAPAAQQGQRHAAAPPTPEPDIGEPPPWASEELPPWPDWPGG